MKSQELSGRESVTAAQETFFFSKAIARNYLIFYESSGMKSEQVTIGKQFFDADREVCRKKINLQIARFGRHLPGSWTYLVE